VVEGKALVTERGKKKKNDSLFGKKRKNAFPVLGSGRKGRGLN